MLANSSKPLRNAISDWMHVPVQGESALGTEGSAYAAKLKNIACGKGSKRET
jgi:hypothetical protein